MSHCEEATLPPCLWCKTAKHVQTGSNLKTFYCRKCKREFEAIDDGDIGKGRPEKRLEREERYQQARKQTHGRRR